MERAGMQKVMESVRHPPALYWAVVSAAALCWGTSVLAKRRGTTPLRRLKRARKHYSGKLRPFLEDFVYGTMALINSFIGALYWILDLFYEGCPPKNKNYIPIISDSSLSKTTTVSEKNLVMMDCSNHMNNTQQTQQVLYKPRRGAIMRLRTRLVKINALRGRRQTCGCWGWVVEDIVTSSPELVCDGHDKVDDALWVSCSAKKPDSHQEGEEEVINQPRWSECHCPECSMLLMPMSVASEKLFVRYYDSLAAQRFVGSGDAQEYCTHIDFPIQAPLPIPGDLSLRSSSKSQMKCSFADNIPVKDGATTAVIFIHGLFSSSMFWFDTDVVPNLSEDIISQHQILVPDLLGCGQSPRPVDSLYTLTDQIEAIERSLIQRQGLQSFHLVGHSMGAIVALALAARSPDRVRSITLIAPVYPPGCLGADGQLAQLPCDAFFSYLNPLTVKGIRALTVCKYYNISRLLGHCFYSKHTLWVSVMHRFLKWYPRSFINDYLTVYHDAAWHVTHNTLLAGTHAVIPAMKKLQEKGQRVLVVHGEADTSCLFRLAEEMRDTFPNVELHAVPNRGHVDIVWGRATETLGLIEKEIRAGDSRWVPS